MYIHNTNKPTINYQYYCSFRKTIVSQHIRLEIAFIWNVPYTVTIIVVVHT